MGLLAFLSPLGVRGGNLDVLAAGESMACCKAAALPLQACGVGGERS